MNTTLIIAFLGGLILTAQVVNLLFKFTKIPTVLVMILVGIGIGPVFGIADKTSIGQVGPVFSTITLFMILFESGTNLKFKVIASAIGSSLFIALFNFFVSATVGYLVASNFTLLNNVESVFFGVIIGGSSSAIVIPIVNQMGLESMSGTILLLESAITDVLCLVIGLSLLDVMKTGASSVNINSILSTIGESFAYAALVGIGAGLLWSFILKWIRKLQGSKFITLAVVFILFGLVEDSTYGLGYNGSIAAMTFGIMLGNADFMNRKIFRFGNVTQELRYIEKDFFKEIVFLLQTFFFVYAGMSITFGHPLTYAYGAAIVLVIYFIRMFSVKIFVRKGLPLVDYSAMSVLAPKGLVPIILVAMVVGYTQVDGSLEQMQDLAISVVLFSIILTSLMIIVLGKNPGFGMFGGLFASKVPAPEIEEGVATEGLSEENSTETSSNTEEETGD